MKYLDMENASLEIEINSLRKINLILKKYIKEFDLLNIKRVTISIKYLNINEVIKIINKILDCNKIDFLLMVRANINDVPAEDFSRFLIINTSNKIFNHDNIYNQIKMNKNSIKKITRCIHNDINVIVEPSIDTDYIKNYSDLITKLYDNNLNYEISLGGFLVPTALIKEHPCNAYLCDGWKCGQKISQLPKVIHIDKEGNIFPHRIFNKKIIIGRINHCDSLEEILVKYLKSPQYEYFKKIVKRVFIKYVNNYPYALFPLDKYIEREINYDKTS